MNGYGHIGLQGSYVHLVDLTLYTEGAVHKHSHERAVRAVGGVVDLLYYAVDRGGDDRVVQIFLQIVDLDLLDLEAELELALGAFLLLYLLGVLELLLCVCLRACARQLRYAVVALGDIVLYALVLDLSLVELCLGLVRVVLEESVALLYNVADLYVDLFYRSFGVFGYI